MNHNDELVFLCDLFHLLPDGLAIRKPLTSNRVGELLSDVFAWMDEAETMAPTPWSHILGAIFQLIFQTK